MPLETPHGQGKPAPIAAGIALEDCTLRAYEGELWIDSEFDHIPIDRAWLNKMLMAKLEYERGKK